MNCPKRDVDKILVYEIKLKGRLDQSWTDWFDGMDVFYEGDVTVLKGSIVDQAALRGLLSKVWDLNRTLISVNRIRDL